MKLREMTLEKLGMRGKKERGSDTCKRDLHVMQGRGECRQLQAGKHFRGRRDTIPDQLHNTTIRTTQEKESKISP
jgi:hypothetical protein